MPTDRLVDEVRNLNGSPAEVFENAELLDLILPIIRSDFALNEQISAQPEIVKLQCPVHVFAGRDDPEVPLETLDLWRATAANHFDLTILQGDHFFLHDLSTVAQMRDHIVEVLDPTATAQSNTALVG